MPQLLELEEVKVAAFLLVLFQAPFSVVFFTNSIFFSMLSKYVSIASDNDLLGEFYGSVWFE